MGFPKIGYPRIIHFFWWDFPWNKPSSYCGTPIYGTPHMAVCQNLVPLVNIKIAGKWMFIPLKMVLIGIDPYPYNEWCFPGISLEKACISARPIHWRQLPNFRTIRPTKVQLAMLVADCNHEKMGIWWYEWFYVAWKLTCFFSMFFFLVLYVFLFFFFPMVISMV